MNHSRSNWIALGLVFVLSAAAYSWVFDYVIVLQNAAPDSFFLFTSRFLTQWLDRPGGLLAYAGHFLRQFYYLPWLGALVIAASITAFGSVWYLSLRRQDRDPAPIYTLLPCALVLALQEGGSNLSIGLAGTCGALLGYLCLRPGTPRRAYAVVMTPLLYVALGAFFWLFVAWVTVSERLGRRTVADLMFRVFFPVLGLFVPLAAYRWVYPVSLEVALTYPLRSSTSVLDGVLLGYLLAIPLWVRLKRTLPGRPFLHSRWGRLSQLVLVAAVTVVAVAAVHDAGTSRFARYHTLYKERRWDAILELTRATPASSRMTQLLANYALYRNGQLLDRMFHYPQTWGTQGLISGWSADPENLRLAMYHSDLWFEMGHMNAAFRFALNQTNLGLSYENVERIAACNIVNGNHQLADKYLNLLELTLFHDQDARRLRKLLDPEAGPAEYAAAGLPMKRPTLELGASTRGFAALVGLVQGDPGNHMAFTYLTAWYLLDKTSVPLLAANMENFRTAGYQRVPVHCQEALGVWRAATGQALDKSGFSFDPGIASRVVAFAQAAQQYRDRGRAQRALRPSFGDTYMYYFSLIRPPQHPADASDWVLLGKEFHAQKKAAHAIRFFRQALREDPGLAEAHIELGRALTAAGDTAAARSHYRRAVSLGLTPGQRQVLFHNGRGTQ